MKTCTVCKKTKTIDNYYNYKAGKDGKGYRCKQCDDLARQKWKENNPERAHRSQRGRSLKCKYGVTLSMYETMLALQDGRCGICLAEENTAAYGFNKSLNFSVDHDHTTGVVRGLLCNQCNRALGMFRDSPEIVGRALAWLTKSSLPFEER